MTSTAIAPGTSVSNRWDEVDLYRFFAYAFGPPNHERFRALSDPVMPESLAELWRILECEGSFPGFKWFQDFEQYESLYIALFDVGLPQPPYALFESAHFKSVPAQELVLENTFFYDFVGLKSDPAKGSPDYLITQLEFLSIVQYTKSEAQEPESKDSLSRLEHDFIHRHLLNWLPELNRKFTAKEDNVFTVLLTMLVKWIETAGTRG